MKKIKYLLTYIHLEMKSENTHNKANITEVRSRKFNKSQGFQQPISNKGQDAQKED